MDQAAIADLPCNPAIGGPGKGHLVREIDAMGGAIGELADQAAMQVRLLNTGKGPAVQALRLLVDKDRYQRLMAAKLAAQPLLTVVVGEAASLALAGGRVGGVRLRDGRVLSAGAVVLSAGVYLRSNISVGGEQRREGPRGRRASEDLAGDLLGAGVELGRFKTGTSPRVAINTVDLAALREEPGLTGVSGFSHWADRVSAGARRSVSAVCWATYTNDQTHQVIRDNLHLSPLFGGHIQGTGPRHCPSIEDKVVRFPDRARHPVFLERESRDGRELYVLGMSTSLPAEIQLAMLHTLPGMTQAVVTRPGYAIEYDFVLPGQLYPTLELKKLPGLFVAGQIAGTSGYEEAAALGLVAGTNAARAAAGQPGVVWRREHSYIGVLIDDVTTRGVSEPYRVMTARAEHRLHLRAGNADLRLSPWAGELGLISAEQAAMVAGRRKRLFLVKRDLRSAKVTPGATTCAILTASGSAPLRAPSTAWSLLKRPEVRYTTLRSIVPGLPDLSAMDRAEVEADAKYGGYIRQQERMVREQGRQGSKRLPSDLDYGGLAGLSQVARRHLAQVRPLTIGQASRVEGVTTSDIAVILGFLRGRARTDSEPG